MKIIETSPDEMAVLKNAEIEVMPVERQSDAWLKIFGITENELLRKLSAKFKGNSD